MKMSFAILFIFLFTSRSFCAEGELELVFQWKPVTGADKYVIEISKEADFQEPLTIDSAKTSSYSWSAAKVQKIYWRVAADGKRKGLFSVPQMIDIADLLKNPEAYAAQGVSLKKSTIDATAESLPKPLPASESELPSAPQPSPPEGSSTDTDLDSDLALPFQAGFHFGGGFQNLRLLGSDLETKVSGPIPMNLRAHITAPISNSRSLIIDAEWMKMNLKPEPAQQFPFQTDLAVSQGRLRLLVGSEDKLAYGLSFRSILRPLRMGAEQVGFENKSLFGLGVRHAFSFQTLDFETHAGAHFGQSITQGDATLRLLFPLIPLERMSFLIGLQVDADLQIHPDIRAEVSSAFRGLFTIGIVLGD